MVRDGAEGPIRVLIAEDDPRARGALRNFLNAHPGFEVVGAAAGPAAAVALARQHAPTVALVDVFLPNEQDGLRLLRALTEDLHIPAVAISLERNARSRALAAGAYRFVDKASVLEVLLAALAAHGTPQAGQLSSDLPG